MDESLEDRIKILEHNVVELMGQTHAYQMLLTALVLHAEKPLEILDWAEQHAALLNDLALFEPVSEKLSELQLLKTKQLLDALRSYIQKRAAP